MKNVSRTLVSKRFKGKFWFWLMNVMQR